MTPEMMLVENLFGCDFQRLQQGGTAGVADGVCRMLRSWVGGEAGERGGHRSSRGWGKQTQSGVIAPGPDVTEVHRVCQSRGCALPMLNTPINAKNKPHKS